MFLLFQLKYELLTFQFQYFAWFYLSYNLNKDTGNELRMLYTIDT